MRIDGVVEVSGLFHEIPVLATTANAWHWVSSELLIWLLPFVVLLALLLFPLEKSTRWLSKWKAAFFLALWMTWSCWLFPAGQWLWALYLKNHGIFCQNPPDAEWGFAIATFFAFPIGLAHLRWIQWSPTWALDKALLVLLLTGSLLGLGLASVPLLFSLTAAG